MAGLAMTVGIPRLLSIQVPTAAKRGSMRQLQWLLACGADIDAGDGQGITALHWTAEQRQPELAHFLLQRGADCNVRDASGRTPLQRAVASGSLSIIRMLFSAGAVVDVSRPTDASMLVSAAKHRNLDIFKLLLQQGLDPDGKFGRYQETPMHRAARNGHDDIVEFLLAQGADPHVLNVQGKTALDLAVAARKTDAIRLLLPATRPEFPPEDLDSFLLHVEAREGRIQTLISLIEAGADPNWKDENGSTPLHQAAAEPQPISIDLLVWNGADVNARNKQQDTPLHLAVQQGCDSTVESLVKHQADVNAVNANGETPLVAALHGSDIADGILEIVKTLLAHGAALDQADLSGKTPLDWARDRNQAVYKILRASTDTPQEAESLSQLEVFEQTFNRMLYGEEQETQR